MAQETLDVITPPASLPVDIEQVKAQVRIDVDDSELTLLTAYTAAATRHAEAYLKRSLIYRQYRWTLDYFPNRLVVNPAAVVLWDTWMNSRLYPYTSAQLLYLPKAPLVSVDQVQYFDPNGTLQTLDPSEYVYIAGDPGRMFPRVGTQYPPTQDRLGGVQITYTAGQAADPAGIDPNIQIAIAMFAAHLYRNREATTTEAVAEMPLGIRTLLNNSSRGFYA